MKKIIALLCSVMLGCSIIPDDAYEDIPQATLKKITITSNTGKDPINPTDDLNHSIYPTKTMIAEATVTEDKVTLELSGELDPIFYVPRATRLIYELNTRGLIDKITLSLEGGYTLTEVFIYNTDDHLLHMEFVDGDFNRIHDFYYVDGVLDSIARRSWNSTTPDNIITGYFKRMNEPDTEHDKFVSILPYAINRELYIEDNDFCGDFDYDSNGENNSYTSFYTFSNDYMRYQPKIVVKKLGGTLAFYNRADLGIGNMNFSGVLNKPLKFTITNVENDFACGGTASPSLNYYSLLDPLNKQYQILYMLMTHEETNFLYHFPEDMTKWADLTFEYEYTLTE